MRKPKKKSKKDDSCGLTNVIIGVLLLIFAFVIGGILPILGFIYIETRWFGGFYDNHIITFKEFVVVFGFLIGYILILLKVIHMTTPPVKKMTRRKNESREKLSKMYSL